MLPGEVTRILVRYAHPDGKPLSNAFTTGPGYVWHCHIVDHEDNEMMRPYLLLPVGNPINGSLLLTNTAISYSPDPGAQRPGGCHHRHLDLHQPLDTNLRESLLQSGCGGCAREPGSQCRRRAERAGGANHCPR